MTDIFAEEMRKTAAAKVPDKETGRLALRFCQQCFRINDARIVDDRHVVAPNLDFTFTDEPGVIGIVNQMCLAYGFAMEMDRRKSHWVVTIGRQGDRTSAECARATSPVLRRAVLQAAIDAHSRYVLPYLGGAREGEGNAGRPPD